MRGFAPRLAAYYAAYFLGIGIQLPFLPLWLAAKGLEPGLIGIVLAVPMAVRPLAVPLVTGLADRLDALRPAIVLGSAATAAGHAVVGLAEGGTAILLLYTVAAFAFTSTMPLVDAYALRGLPRRGRGYGAVRLWGSASFIAGSLGAGALLHVVAAVDLIWLITGAYVATALASLALAPIPASGQGRPPAAAGARWALLRDPVFVAVLVGASLVQASHALLYGFATIAWEAAGLSGSSIGALWAIGVVAEIILFAASSRLPATVTPTLLLALGAAGAMLRWTAMALDPPLALLPLLQCLHALSFAATHLGAIGFVNRAAPAALAATAQGHLSVALGVAMATTTAASGVLFATLAERGYAVMAGVAMIGLACALLAHGRWRDEDSRAA